MPPRAYAGSVSDAPNRLAPWPIRSPPRPRAASLWRAQGFGRARPDAVGTRQLNLAIERLGLLQLDSVNVFERSHYLPLFARLGPYDKTLLDKLTFARKGPLRRVLGARGGGHPRRALAAVPLAHAVVPARLDRPSRPTTGSQRTRRPSIRLRAELAEKGPLPASEFERDGRSARGPWWDWDDVKRGLERMFRLGEVVSAGARNFERIYALPEQVLPPAILDARHPA